MAVAQLALRHAPEVLPWQRLQGTERLRPLEAARRQKLPDFGLVARKAVHSPRQASKESVHPMHGSAVVLLHVLPYF